MDSPAAASQKKLRETYAALSSTRQTIVQLFALLYQPTNLESALKCWQLILGPKPWPLEATTLAFFTIEIQKIKSVDVLVQAHRKGVICPRLLVDIAIRDAIKQGNFDKLAAAIAQVLPVLPRYSGSKFLALTDHQHALREIRIAIYQQNRDRISLVMESLEHVFWQASLDFQDVFFDICCNPFDRDWIQSLSPEFYAIAMVLLLSRSIGGFLPIEGLFELLEDTCESAAEIDAEIDMGLQILYAEQLLFRGSPDAAIVLERLQPRATLLAKASSKAAKLGPAVQPMAAQLWGMMLFLQGQVAESIEVYRASLVAMGKAQARHSLWFSHPAAAPFLLALLKEASPRSIEEATTYVTLLLRRPDHRLYAPCQFLTLILQIRQGKVSAADPVLTSLVNYSLEGEGIAALLEALCLYWLDSDLGKDYMPTQLKVLYQRATEAGYVWVAMETAALMAQLQPDSTLAEAAEILRQEMPTLPLVDIVERKNAWELSLNALMNLTTDATAVAPKEAMLRLVWLLRLSSTTNWLLQPLEQKFSSKSGWTKGRSIALKRLKSAGDLPYLTPQDLQVCKFLDVNYYNRGYYGAQQMSYEFDPLALVALVGHPLVFWEETPTVRVDVVAGAPELLVRKMKGDRLAIELSPRVPAEESVLAVKETPTRVKVLEIQPAHQRIAEILGAKNRLEVPAQAQEQVLGAIAAISNLVTVQSDIGGGVAAEEVPAEATPHIHLLPDREGLKVTVLVRPFPGGGPYYAPGKGGETVIAEVEGKRLQTQRDLKDEKRRAKEIAAACPTLQALEAEKGEWQIEEPEDCLELLLELKELGDRAILEWPEGEKFRVARQLGLGDWNLRLSKQNEWFEASGEVQINEGQVMDMRQLMALLGQGNGRFVQLADGQFVALTEEFRRRLQDLDRFSQAHGKGVRFHGLAAMAIDDVVADVENLKVDKAWKENLKRIRSAQDLQPVLPDRLQAELRDYQTEGYNWMARLAHWGVGACLADDMGLGKTLQAMAIILSRSSEGPTLVLAPTSVCMNWIGETEKFAPSLKVIVFGSGDRQQTLDQLQPQDLVICSYGLLQQDDVAAMLAQVSWQTIVLDEAQAIKNHATKRSQAAMTLQGQFKVITTGTPIENHLGELWNLFRFINPGLLGSLETFNERFANPIERDHNDQARDTLRRLIQPFILRRTKDQVLQELPSRTEVTLHVDLSPEEMAFYEALRREAIAKLSESDAPAGQKHLQVLAEIMKLRRACCNSRLVRPEMGIPSAKLEQFGEVLRELLDNGHKALVFSQFVDHLSILREYLDDQQIAYQYLDGSTPAKQRKLRVDAFQQGEGDVFLISLKAGGTGLNLTAADYVIHMDPWWNPAVEDQASDRAHRIGQQRPVTIYRLVARGTIEAKIVDLHQQKRDLADSLLDGTDMSSKVSTAELLRLIQQ